MLNISIVSLGQREFFHIEGVVSIPVDRIVGFDLNAPNGGSTNSVKIITDDPEDDFIFAYSNADSIREFLKRSNNAGVVDTQHS